jgi:hypothetical protein
MEAGSTEADFRFFAALEAARFFATRAPILSGGVVEARGLEEDTAFKSNYN